jgi:hypothetical protein
LIAVTDTATRRLAYVDALIAFYKALADLDAAEVKSGVRLADLTDAQRAALRAYDEARQAYLGANSQYGV